MRERPIIFNSEMVRAVMEGRKVQTRRIMKIQPAPSKTKEGDFWFPCKKMESMVHISDLIPDEHGAWPAHEFFSMSCPFGAVGDRLWVRETWQVIHDYLDEQGNVDERRYACSIPKQRGNYWHPVYSEACGEENQEYRGFPWRPSIHMPRWASRITLEITNVGVQRLQSISQNDAVREGLVTLPASGRYCINQGDQYFGGASHDVREVFSWLWSSIYGEESWQANPFVWVITFKRVEGE